MPPLRVLLPLICFGLTAVFLLFQGTTSQYEPNVAGVGEPGPRGDHLRPLLYFQNPASFFTPTATISLTDDNSTFFAARPAAFGPALPTHGLSGRLWIGSGFGDDGLVVRRFAMGFEGELGCNDIWDWALQDGPAMEQRPQGKQSAEHAGAQSLQEAYEISGKVVLLSRGGCGFSEKVKWAQRRGAIAVIIGDNVRGGPLVRMYARGDTSNITIPSLFTSHTTAHLLSTLIPDEDDFYMSTSSDANSSREMEKSVSTNANKLREMKQSASTGSFEAAKNHKKKHDDEPELHQGLWVTLTPTDMNSSPFFHTLFVLVISPLLTLIIVYSMLLLRSRIRRRRWRAPKSVVERLPVRVYHTFSNSTNLEAMPETSTSATPLLAGARTANVGAHESTSSTNAPASTARWNVRESEDPDSSDSEKSESDASEWKHRCKVKQIECVVCLEEYVDGVSRVMSLPCGHEFHVDCITPWLTTRRRTCPICKGDVVRSMSRRAAMEAAAAAAAGATGATGAAGAAPNHANSYEVSFEEAEAAHEFEQDPEDMRDGPLMSSVARGRAELSDDLASSSGASSSSRPRRASNETAGSSQWIARHVNRGIDYLWRMSQGGGGGEGNGAGPPLPPPPATSEQQQQQQQQTPYNDRVL